MANPGRRKSFAGVACRLETDEGLGASAVVVKTQRVQRRPARPRRKNHDLAVVGIAAAIDKIDGNRQPHRRPLHVPGHAPVNFVSPVSNTISG
jgi:hypothetical protein